MQPHRSHTTKKPPTAFKNEKYSLPSHTVLNEMRREKAIELQKKNLSKRLTKSYGQIEDMNAYSYMLAVYYYLLVIMRHRTRVLV